MKSIIQKISLYRCPVKLKQPFIISLGRLDYADNVILTIETSEGITGYGECSPFATIHGETGETCMVTGKLIAERLLGQNAIDIAGCIALMDALLTGNSSIKSAFDMALHDVLAKSKGLPLYRLLGGVQRELVTDYTVSIGPVEKMADDAEKILADGFGIIKVKLGGTAEDDVARIRAIRNRVGQQVPLRIDANQGWKKEEAINILKALSPFDIQHCEEPIARNQFLALPKIRRESPIPLMADESCFDHVDAQRLVELGACDMLNIKLGKSGIHKAGKIASLATENNIVLQAGGFLESRLGFSATAHLALSSPLFRHIDFDTPLMFSEDYVEGGIEYHRGGRITVPDTPGIGATIPAKVLGKLEKVAIGK